MDIISFDVETTPFSMLKPELNICGFSNGLTEIFFDSIEMCQKFIMGIKKDTIFVAHNLQFDYNIIFDFNLAVYPMGIRFEIYNINGDFPHFAILTKIWKENEWIDGSKGRGHKSHYKCHTKTVHLYFMDLMNFQKSSLESLMKSYCPQFLDDKIPEFDIRRNRADILSTRFIYAENFYKIYEKHTPKKIIEKPFLSMSSISYHDLVNTCNYKWIDVDKYGRKKRNPHLIKVEQMSYCGGIVYCNPKFLGKSIHVYDYDINSMYPFVMSLMKVPIGFLGRFHLMELSDQQCREHIITQFNNEYTYSIYHVIMTIKTPCIAVRKEGKLTVPIGEVKGWFNETELYYAMNKPYNKIEKIHLIKEIRYKAIKGMFKPFIDKWYKQKEDIDLERKELFKKATTDEEKAKIKIYKEDKRQESKLMMNTAYGHFGMRQRHTVIISYNEERYQELLRKTDLSLEEMDEFQHLVDFREIEKENGDYYEYEGINYTIRKENSVLFLDTKLPNESFSSVTIVASDVTDYARAYLMSFVDENTTVYTDTDSIFSTIPLPSEVVGTKLGQFKLEKEGVVIIKGKKDYIFDEETKIKGIPIVKKNPLFRAKQLEENEYKYYKVIRPREANKRGLIPFTLVVCHKRLKRKELIENKSVI